MPQLELGVIARFRRGGVPVVLATLTDPGTVRIAIEAAIASARQERGGIARQQEIRLLGELLGQIDQKSVV